MEIDEKTYIRVNMLKTFLSDKNIITMKDEEIDLYIKKSFEVTEKFLYHKNSLKNRYK